MISLLSPLGFSVTLKTREETAVNIYSLTLMAALVVSVTSCSKAQQGLENGNPFPVVQTFPIENSELKNCRFQTANPVYSLGQKIPDNRISCDQGVPRSVQLLNPNPLPGGLQFSLEKLALIGTPGERVQNGAYTFYLENEAGYVTLKMSLSVK